MKNRERILKYLSSTISDTEAKKFEKELASSSLLKKEFDEIKQRLNKLSGNAKVEIKTGEFNKVLAGIHERKMVNKPLFSLKRASAFVFVITIFALVIFRSQEDDSQTDNRTEYDFASINDSSLLNDAADFIELSELNNIYKVDHSFQENIIPDEYLGYAFGENIITLDEIDILLTDNEYDQIYNEIMQRTIL